MAIEKLFLGIKQEYFQKASDLSGEGSSLLVEGRREEAEERLGAAKLEIDKTRRVDDILVDILDKLKAAGIEQPPEDFLKRLVSGTIEAQIARTPEATKEEVVPERPKEPEEEDSVRRSVREIIKNENFKDLEVKALELMGTSEKNAVPIDVLARSLYQRHNLKQGKYELNNLLSYLKQKLQPNQRRTFAVEIVNPATQPEKILGLSRYYLRLIEPQWIQHPTSEPEAESQVESVQSVGEEIKRFTNREIYGLARFLGQSSDEKLSKIGIQLHKADREAVSLIAEKLEAEYSETKINMLILALKLYAFINDRELFLENADSDETQLILAALASVDSEERMQELLNSIK